jgi:hypothetical protein
VPILVAERNERSWSVVIARTNVRSPAYTIQREMKTAGRSYLAPRGGGAAWWLFALLLAAIVPGGWALVGGGVFALALATLYARARRLRPLRVAGLAFVCITLEWPPVSRV